ncbi:MAG: hypothetical protein F4W90_03300 [Gammaproteobacteria bacterium]|nr:hypothetical protein [Gammaproteobacteria bacterium]
MLHLVQSRTGLEKCKQLVQNGDDVVFIGDGVLAYEQVANCRVFIHAIDAERCGVETTDDRVVCTSSELVKLVAKHDHSATWR